MANNSRIYFTKAVATATGDAFLAGHVQNQGHEPTFTRFAKAGSAGWTHLGDLGSVAYAAKAIPIESEQRPWIAVLGRDGPLRLYKPGQQPTDVDIPIKEKTAYLEGLCSATDGLYVCGGQRQILRYAANQWISVDQGLFVKFDGSNDCTLLSIEEVSAGSLVVVGDGGFVAYRAAGAPLWRTLNASTNFDLNCVIAAEDGGAWVAGDGGTLLKIATDMAVVLDHSAPDLNKHSFDCLALYKGTLYVTAFNALLALHPGKALEAVSGPFVKGSEFHSVSVAGDYLWLTGDENAYRLGPDGWQHFLCPDNF